MQKENRKARPPKKAGPPLLNLTIDGVGFTVATVGYFTQAAFLEKHAHLWPKLKAEERDERLKAVYKLLKDANRP